LKAFGFPTDRMEQFEETASSRSISFTRRLIEMTSKYRQKLFSRSL
jgi:hypothetical protein